MTSAFGSGFGGGDSAFGSGYTGFGDGKSGVENVNSGSDNVNASANQARKVPNEVEEILSRPGDRKIHFKVKFEQNARRFAVPNDIVYSELCRVTRFLFDIDEKAKLEMSYSDGTGSQLIVFDTDFELQEIARQAAMYAVPKWAEPVCLHVKIK